MSKQAKQTTAANRMKNYDIACPDCGTIAQVPLPMGCYSRPTTCDDCGHRWDATP